ncbi:cyanophycin synthetase [Aggregicoccus sp. 17bor-14]|uniref:cyanophycin synthetase n=1 Tax=Myxococcaceae TaxID=31 RepID=UPI00129C19F8|nr:MULTISPECIES: cyanophycin synthetase [Myxococcaceae]MBF5046128.1 cyanophycin synthetase [Simulacricoccus sp. 17bor-14]MRI91855.1 cyanophycin synthetase [Aggregicoccus sp. 17bor-14]
MELVSVRALRGPNIWTRRTVLVVTLRVAAVVMAATAEAVPAEALAAEELETRVRQHLPQLPVPSLKLSHAAALPLMFERVARGLLLGAGCAAEFSRVSPTQAQDTWEVVLEYGEEPVGRKAVADAHALLQAAASGQPYDAQAAIKELRALDENSRLGPTTGSIARAALARGIPVRRLNEGSLVQFGWGARQRRILASETDRTGAIGESIAQDKELTKTLLRAVGVPVPAGRAVESAEDAWDAALEVGLPVVLKPRYGSQGRGVAVNLQSKEQVLAAYASAREHGSSILVEKCATGMDHRLLVIGHKLVAAARREPPQVTGDGVRSVAELVDEVNRDPQRGEDHATSLSKIPLDAIALGVLAEQGLVAESVPQLGQRVLLRRNANLSTGGSAADVTDIVHPDVAALAVDAARMVGLDVCGVDVVCHDITRPLEEQGGVFVEVNAAPGFRMHLAPSRGLPRPVGEAVMSTLFSGGEQGRIPTVAVTGNNGKTTTVRLIAHLLEGRGLKVGMTCTDGVYVGGRRIDTGDCSGPKSARSVLANPSVEAAVLETARGGILREGLGFDRCDVAVLTNIGEGDHLGMNEIDTPQQLAAVKRVIAENVSSTGHVVLNAADPLTLAMAARASGPVTLFALDKDLPALQAHRARGGRAVYVDGGTVVAAEGASETALVAVDAIPLTRGGRIRFQVENVLAAVGAGWGLGLPWESVRAGLLSFANDFQSAPGRFNVVEHNGATIIVDYGHNVDAFAALVDAVNRLPSQRRIAVLTGAGDRRDMDLQRLGEILGNHFDEVGLFEDACNRGRKDGEVIELLRRGVATGSRVSHVAEFRGELVALEATLRRLRPGDIGLLLIDEVDRSLAWLREYLAGGQPAALVA